MNIYEEILKLSKKQRISNVEYNVQKFINESTEFLPNNSPVRQKIWHILNFTQLPPKCKNAGCNNRVKFDKTKYREFCSRTCIMKSSETLEKHKNTCLQKYGETNPSKSLEVKEKKRLSSQEKYGTDCPLQSTIIKQNIENTNMTRYGVKNPSQLDSVKQKKKETNLKNNGVENPAFLNFSKDTFLKLQNKNWLIQKHHLDKIPLKGISFELGIDQHTISRYFKKHNIKIKTFNSSIGENRMYDFIKENYDGTVIQGCRDVIPPKEIDIYLPDLKIGFEFNGLYFHSQTSGKGKSYHYDKMKECIDKGIRLIHVFENEWETKKDICKSRILDLIGKSERIFARKCTVVEVDSKTKDAFLEANHMQGTCSSKINMGLEYNGELISLMTFGKSRFNKAYDFELIRFCSKLNHCIVGGASKILDHFIGKYNPKNIISYADYRWSDGGLYMKLGFEYLHSSQPNYWYFKKDTFQIFHRVNFQKHKLEKKLQTYDKELTEYENMVNNGYHRIFDCGNGVYILDLQKKSLSATNDDSEENSSELVA